MTDKKNVPWKTVLRARMETSTHRRMSNYLSPEIKNPKNNKTGNYKKQQIWPAGSEICAFNGSQIRNIKRNGKVFFWIISLYDPPVFVARSRSPWSCKFCNCNHTANLPFADLGFWSFEFIT